MKKLILAGAALLLSLPVLAGDPGLSIAADKKVIETGKNGPSPAADAGKQAKTKKKTRAKKKKGSGYKFRAQDTHQYRYDRAGKPLTGKEKKRTAKNKARKPSESGYKFKREGTKSSYKLDEEANPIRAGRPKKAASPKKSGPKKKTGKEDPPPYDDSLSVDKKVISLEGE